MTDFREMDGALLERLVAEAGANGEFVGGLVIALLYVIVGLLAAVGSILVVPRMFQGRWEQIFWALFLVVIAAFYLSLRLEPQRPGCEVKLYSPASILDDFIPNRVRHENRRLPFRY